MCFSVAGCKLVTTNNEADLAQTVATVQISEDAPKDEIKKQEMIMAYLNYGYYAYSGYSTDVVYKTIIKNLVNSRILVQNALMEFDKGEAPFDSVYVNTAITDKWNPERYLTNTDQTEGGEVVKLSDVHEIEYETIKHMNEFVKGYMEPEETYAPDTLTAQARPVPTNAKNDEKVTPQEKLDYIAKGIDTGATNAKIRDSYVTVLKVLENNNLLGKDYDGDIKNSDYYKNVLKSYQESKLIEKYENCLKDQTRKSITFADLEANYLEMYEKQTEYTAKELSEAMSSATYDNPMVYLPGEGYGYVYNLLLGANDKQAEQITALTGSDAEKIAERRAILDGLTVKDLRSSWILSGYDFDVNTKKFTGDYAFLEDSLAFNGTVELVKEKDEDKGTNAEYRVSANEMKLNEFVAYMNNYLFGAEDLGTTGEGAVYKKYSTDTAEENFEDRVNELLFAYSTDPGSLNTYKGYVIEPSVLGAETYVKEFADAGRELITSTSKYSYQIVGTNYGYHIMFYVKGVGADFSYPTLEDYLSSLDSDKGGFSSWQEYYDNMIANWNDEDIDSDFYLYKLQNLYADKMVTSSLSDTESKLIENYRKDSNKVKIYNERFADLLA